MSDARSPAPFAEANAGLEQISYAYMFTDMYDETHPPQALPVVYGLQPCYVVSLDSTPLPTIGLGRCALWRHGDSAAQDIVHRHANTSENDADEISVYGSDELLTVLPNESLASALLRWLAVGRRSDIEDHRSPLIADNCMVLSRWPV